jgi:tetrahydromethanopterin S-methyltransferase subunit C
MCPQASIGTFLTLFFGKKLRALHPTNDCELEGGLKCINPSEHAVQTVKIAQECPTVMIALQSFTEFATLIKCIYIAIIQHVVIFM